MSDSNATRATLAAREAAARTALGRLRDCSRDVERLAADARAAGRDSLAEHLRPRVRAFTIEAARIRVELRRWDVGSSLWIALLQARLDRLAAEIGLLAEVTCIRQLSGAGLPAPLRRRPERRARLPAVHDS